MSNNQSRLGSVGLVCCNDVKDKTQTRLPNPMLLSNVSLLLQILEMIVQDWKREATPLQNIIDNASSDNEKFFHFTKAFGSLQPLCLKCLFSYSVFFVALEGAYDRFYEELNAFNRKPFMQVTHEKKPKSTLYINKVRMIRNISISHIGSNKVQPINAARAMMWQPMTLSKGLDEPWNLDNITFGDIKLTFRDTDKAIVQSDDLTIKGIAEMDNMCAQYLDQYDRVCATYLNSIALKLPISLENVKYSMFKT